MIIILCRSINRQISKISWRLRQLVNYCLLPPNLDLCSPLPGAGLGCCKTNICFARWPHVGLCWKGTLDGQNITLFLVCLLSPGLLNTAFLLILSQASPAQQQQPLKATSEPSSQFFQHLPTDFIMPSWPTATGTNMAEPLLRHLVLRSIRPLFWAPKF